MNATDTEHLIHQTAVAAARALKIESDRAFNAVLAVREERDNATNRLKRVEASHLPRGLNVADTAGLIDDLKSRILDLESAVTDAEERCRFVCAHRLAEHDRMIAQAAAEIAAKRDREEQEAAATLELNHRKVAMQAHERFAHRQRQVEERRQVLKGAA